MRVLSELGAGPNLRARSLAALVLLAAAHSATAQGQSSNSRAASCAGQTPLWEITSVVDSRWAGTMLLRWNSANGETFVSSGEPGKSEKSWSSALANVYWLPFRAFFASPAQPACAGRFVVHDPVAFGNSARYENERHAIVMLDTYTGTAYVAVKDAPNGVKNFLYHDDFSNAYWHAIAEDSARSPGKGAPKALGRYVISVNETSKTIPGEGTLGPFLIRLDRVTGEAHVAYFDEWDTPSKGATDLSWKPIGVWRSK